jgi:hypothetical protein
MKQVRETQVKGMVNMSKTSLDETVGWMYAGGKTTCKTDMKQGVKHMMKRPAKRAREK